VDGPQQGRVKMLAQLVLNDLAVISVTLDVVLSQADLEDDVRQLVVRAQERLITAARRLRESDGLTEE
jgi:hypothetical protein